MPDSVSEMLRKRQMQKNKGDSSATRKKWNGI